MCADFATHMTRDTHCQQSFPCVKFAAANLKMRSGRRAGLTSRIGDLLDFSFPAASVVSLELRSPVLGSPRGPVVRTQRPEGLRALR